MLKCCNTSFRGVYRFVVQNNSNGYRRVEFGICPKCGSYSYLDYKENANDGVKIKSLHGKEALSKFNSWEKHLTSQKHGSFVNQNVHYGEFRKTRRRDENGNPIYLQLRKNFNNEVEVLNEIRTHTASINKLETITMEA